MMNSRRIIGLAILIIGLGLCGRGLMLLLMPPYYEAAVKIVVQPDVAADGTYQPYDPYFMESELKAIQSESVLSNVVQALNLQVEWGKRYGSGRVLGNEEAITLIRQHMALNVPQNTHLIEIRIVDKNPDMPARMANTIADAYKNYRIEQYKERMNRGIEKLEDDYRAEETNIMRMQSNVDQMRDSIHIHEPVSSPLPPELTKEAIQHYNLLLIQGNASYMKLKKRLAELQELQATNPMMLRDVLPTIVNDSELFDLLAKLQESEQKLNAETGFPRNTNMVEPVDSLNKQIDARVQGIMIGMASNVKSQKAALDALTEQVQNAETNMMAGQAYNQPYWQAKRELEEKMNLHRMLAAKIESDKADAMVPRSDLVTIIDPAVTPLIPAGPNRGEGAGLLIGGLVLSCFGIFSLHGGNIKGSKRG